MNRNQRIGLALAALALVITGFLLLRPKDDGGSAPATTAATETAAPGTTAPATVPTTTAPVPPPPRVTTIAVKDGAPVGGEKTITVTSGDTVRLRVTANVADVIHVHGYDLEKPVPAGGSVTFTFKATSEGVFDVEAHSTDTKIAKLEVTP
ncbi:MAG: hypothetical protein U0R70_14400 [Solirubrobacteraceae bacterium]